MQLSNELVEAPKPEAILSTGEHAFNAGPPTRRQFGQVEPPTPLRVFVANARASGID
jgi:hypothetical protein